MSVSVGKTQPEISFGTTADSSNGSMNSADVVALLVAVSLIVGYLPVSVVPWHAPRFVALLLSLPYGLYALTKFLRVKERAAILVCSYLVWATVAGFLSAAPMLSIFGGLGRYSSVLTASATAGLWAIGRQMTPWGRNALLWTVVGSVGVSSCIAIIQLTFQPSSIMLSLELGRPVGLAGNPIYYGAHVSAVAALFAYRYSRNLRARELIAFGCFAFFAGLSGSRVALLGVVGVAVVGSISARRLRAGALVPVAILAGVGASLAHRVAGTGQSAGDRVGTSGLSERLDLWSFGVRAFLDRPVQGWGLGRFRQASQGHYSDAWVRRFPNEMSGGWPDAHNFVIEHLVATGLVGVALLLSFIYAASRHSEGPWSWMAAAVAVTWTLQPATLTTYGLAALLIGAAAPRSQLRAGEGTFRRVHGVLLLGGTALAVSYLLSDLTLNPAHANVESHANFPVWAPWLRIDPAAANAMATRFTPLSGNTDPDVQQFVILWSDRATERESDLPLWWSNLAIRQVGAGDLGAARLAAERGLELQPNHPPSLQALQIVASRIGDDELLTSTTKLLCALEIHGCDYLGSDGAPP